MILKPGQIVMTITLLVLIAGCGLFPGSDQAVEASPAPTEAEIDELLGVLQTCRAQAPTVAGIVWLKTGVQPAEVADLDVFLVKSPFITDHHYVDEDETYRQFTEYFADEPEILDLVEADQLPTSFEIGLEEDAEFGPLLDEIERLPAVDSVELKPNDIACLAEAEAMKVACGQPPQGFLVWMSPGIDEADVAAISEILAGSRFVEGFRYVGLDESYAEFVAFYGDASDVVALVDPDQLPTSFKIDFVPLDEPANDRTKALDVLKAELESFRSVDDIEEGPFQLFAICQSAELS